MSAVDTAVAGALPAAPRLFSPAYRWYALGVLFLAYVFNFIDRSILSILAQPIKDEFHISDTMLGWLGGPAFALFYSGLGIPLARLADRSVRRNVIATCVAIWSGMTVACGFATNFWQLLAARVGVAIGEAGGSPPSHSMISDMFPQAERATALSIYSLGITVGGMIGGLAGGLINAHYGWHYAFFLVGAPGLLMALVVRFTLREPERGAAEPSPVHVSADVPPLSLVFRTLWSRRSFRYLSVAAGFHAFVGYASGAWVPAMFMRSFNLDSAVMGKAGFLLGFAGIFGMVVAGYCSDRLGRRDARWYMWIPALSGVLSIPFSVATYLWPEPFAALWIYAIPSILGAFYIAPTFAMTQGLVGVRMRALAASILLLILSLIGLGLGPLLTGVLSDWLTNHTTLGVNALRYALVAATFFLMFATIANLLAARTIRDDLARSAQTAADPSGTD